MFQFPLTFHVRFFAREVAHHGLQLTQLTMCRVNVGLAVGPADADADADADAEFNRRLMNKNALTSHRQSENSPFVGYCQV